MTPRGERAAGRLGGGGLLPLALIVFLTLAPPAAALEQTLIAGDGAADDELGTSVAIDGDVAVAGAPRDDNGRGAAYVFERSGDTWTNTSKLIASDGSPAIDGGLGDRFGTSVAIDGDTIVVGAPRDRLGDNTTQGSAYAFPSDGPAIYIESAKLTSSDGAAVDFFGQSVAIDGDTIVIGAVGAPAGDSEGAAYTFARTGAAARTETAKLTIADPDIGDGLGGAVAIDGATIVAGAFRHDGPDANEQGAVFTFARTGPAARTETAVLKASDGALFDVLGGSLAIDGDTIVAGAVDDEAELGDGEGSVYTFASTGSATRTETAKLTASIPFTDEALGTSVAIDGPTIVGGAPAPFAAGEPGSAYTFDRAGSAARTETAALVAATGETGDALATAIAIDGKTIVAGAPSDNVGTKANQGSATIFFEPTRTCGSKPATIVGTGDGETLVGTAGRDVIAALAGGDTVKAAGGNDTVCAGAGADGLAGQDGKDLLFGQGGRDSLAGGAGAGDLCNGGKARDEAVPGCERTKAIP